MENGNQNGLHPNLTLPASLTGAMNGNKSPEKSRPDLPSQISDGNVPTEAQDNSVSQDDAVGRVGGDPPAITHITEGFLSLPRLLVRRAQVSHNTMTQMIHTLASMQVTGPVMNGNGSHAIPEDTSAENMKKKVLLLKYAEKEHADWVKALVITSWTRVSEDVRKLIDLKVHIDAERLHYDWALENMVEVKRNLVHARLPNPDLKTALEILSTGKAPWMPDLGYIEPPALTATQLVRSLQDLNTLLAMRLTLQEYDRIPFQFRDFSVNSGRVTFRVDGEFELELTIADENPEAQFWFIDFRFSFAPTVSEIPESLRSVIENRVNAHLEKDGLQGAYRYLHELTLTHKIGELRRQAAELGRGRWIGSLNAEPLHRALSIQYWNERFGPKSPNSWIILGVDSGRREGKHESVVTSEIQMRWFRDTREVKQFDIQLDLKQLSAEDLIQQVIDEHSLVVLRDLYEHLSSKQLYQGDLSLTLRIKPELSLDIQLTHEDSVSIAIEPVTGRFAIAGGSRIAASAEMKLNSQSRTPAATAQEVELLRCGYVSDKIVSRALGLGWVPTRNPGITSQDLKSIVSKDTLQMLWLRRPGWDECWIIAVTASMAGETFWLFRTNKQVSAVKIKTAMQIPTVSTTPALTYSFFSALHVITAALVSYHTNTQYLHSQKIPYRMLKSTSSAVPVPTIVTSLTKILPTRGRSWAKDILKLTFHGIEPAERSRMGYLDGTIVVAGEDVHEHVILVVQSVMSSPMPANLDLVRQQVDKDISFHPSSGAFAIRLRQQIGTPVISTLRDRLVRVEQLVRFVRIIKKHSAILHLENISLGKIELSYHKSVAKSEAGEADRPKRRASIDFGGEVGFLKITFEPGNPHIRLLDYFTKILNSEESLDGVATFLPLTLPVLCVCDTIEDSWVDNEQGEVMLLSRAVDWHVVRYELTKSETRVDIDIKLEHRRSTPWWVIRRVHRQQPPQADFVENALLQKVWSAEPDEVSNWRGMHTSAIAQDNGVEIVLKMIDQVMQDLAANPPVVEEPTKPVVKEPAPILPPQKTQPATTSSRANLHQQAQKQQQRNTPILPPNMMGRAISQQQQRLQAQQQQRKKKDAIVID